MKSYVYILTNKKNGVLYTGVTKCLGRRMWQHVTGYYEGFTKKYRVKKLVYCEKYSLLLDAIDREKQIKKWKREWKIRLIEKKNPNRENLYSKIEGYEWW